MNNKHKMLKSIEAMDSLTGKLYYNYELSHEYDIEHSSVCFQTNIAPDILSPLLAYIEFQNEINVNESYDIATEDIVKVIGTFYSYILPAGESKIIKIDLYYNRENWCGAGLHEFQPFERDGLIDELKRIIPVDA